MGTLEMMPGVGGGLGRIGVWVRVWWNLASDKHILAPVS